MEDKFTTRRSEEIDEQMHISKCKVDFLNLVNIVKHAESSKVECGWGKLLGFFEP